MSYINGNIVDAVEKTLKDFGIDWILEERGTKFDDLMKEIELAIDGEL